MEITKHIEYLEPNLKAIEASFGNKKSASLKLVQAGFSTFGRIFPSQAGALAYKLFSTPRGRARHKTSDEVLEKAQLFEFLYGKQILKGYTWGKGEECVLLVHGWESRGTALRSFVPTLVNKGYRVIAFDGPAHGNSDGKRTNLIHFAGAVRAAINHVGGVHSIICHSFGGASTVFAMAQLDPSIQVEKLILIAVPNHLDRVLLHAVNTMKLPKAAAKKFYNIIENKIKTSKESVNISDAYDRIQVEELLLVYDRKDPIVSFANAETIFEQWDNVSLLVSEGYGHFKLVKNPDLIQKVADFIHK